MRYKLTNPNKFLVPIMLKRKSGEYEQKYLEPRTSIEISTEEISDSIKNLASSPRNILRLKVIKD